MQKNSFYEKLEEANHLLIYREYEEACKIYEELLKENSSAELHNNYGLALFYLDKYEEALQQFDRAIQLEENFCLPYINTGLIYLNRGEYEKAVEFLTKAITLDNKNSEAHYNIAVAYYRLNKKKEALFHYEEFIKNSGNEYVKLKESVGKIIEQIKTDLSKQESCQE
ncbi:MAG: tetratricopeptide repeat protein [Thermodesulfovibrionaceae bacterium]